MNDLITLPRATVQQALEALEAGPDVDPIFAGETEVALRAALAQPHQFASFVPRPPYPPPAPGGYDGTEAGLNTFSWSNHV